MIFKRSTYSLQADIPTKSTYFLVSRLIMQILAKETFSCLLFQILPVEGEGRERTGPKTEWIIVHRVLYCKYNCTFEEQLSVVF